jgi:hypothetical protein
MRRLSFFILGVIVLALIVPMATAQASITVSGDRATIEFPDRITFSISLRGDTQIDDVVLEYGVEQLTCGNVIAKAFPDFQPSKNVDAKWAWEMKQSGSLPPGAKIWWRWRVTDAQNHETLTERQSIVWLDDQHAWQTISGGSINLHYYQGGASTARDLHDSAVKSLDDLAQTTGMKAEAPIDLYIYASQQDLRDAILYEAGWVGGQAFFANNIVIIGIAADQIEWGKRAQAHELTHVLVGYLTFTCLGDKPTWLNEGLAMVGEGGPEPESMKQLDQAIADDTLMSVRSLSGNFSENPNKADLSYSESYSLVNFLIDQYGQDKMLALLRALRDGATIDEALHATYHFDIDGFEDAWRASVKARPRAGANETPTPTQVPTQVPTFVPISAGPIKMTPAPTRARPTPTPIVIAQANAEQAASTPQPVASPAEVTNSTPILIGLAIAAVIIAAVAVFAISRRQQRMKP